MTQSARRRLLLHMAAQARELAANWSGRNFEGATPDEAAQAAVCAAPILGSCRFQTATAISWLEPQLASWECTALQQAVDLSAGFRVLPLALSPHHLYDGFLHVHSRSQRKQHGVFFTPQPIAEYI